ncbi:MAG: trypsin-like peptidase domain-containing protein [Candidatus Aminicenantes bacterium]|nr:trypsin-like peptidase domain-containing protein [Candidatus Aminicenantes bacterium]
MRTKQWLFLLILSIFISAFCFLSAGERLTEEQMTAYRTRPAVAMIYSGMFVKAQLKGGQTIELPNYGSGSGFFINPDGYLATNGHVVDIYVKYTADKDGYAQKTLRDAIIQQIIVEFKKSKGREPSGQELEAAFKQFMQDQQPRITEHGAINYVLLSNSETFRFEVKKFSPSIPDGGKDIAVLKIERENCPVIMLGDSSQLALQEPIFVIGFPGVVDPQRFPLLGKENTLRSSITRGSISALKTDFKGMAVIQHDAATSPGNSGGPAVDIKGRVVGVHSYAATGADGFKFCVPINSAREFIRETGIETNKLSEFSVVFNKLMDAAWKEEWFDARGYVGTALAYMKNEPDLEKMQQMILTRISEMGFLEKIWRQSKIIVIIVAVLMVLILVVLKIAFSPMVPEREAAAPHGGVGVGPVTTAPPPPDKTKAGETGGAVLEGEAAGSVTVLVKGEDKGTFNITSYGITVGRDPMTVNVHITDNIVSKNHLKILPRGDQFFLVDLGSTNGTYVNGQKIKETLASPDDMVQLGKKGDIKLILRK